MPIKQSQNPYGFKNLLVFKKAEELQSSCALLVRAFPKIKTLIALADQMDRSARSVKQNIVEGWKRNSTKDYYEFLGFSIAANAELEEDCNDIIRGVYAELVDRNNIMGEKGKRGLMGEMGKKYEIGEWRTDGLMGERGTNEDGGTKEENRMDIRVVESLPFYPIKSHLPPFIQLKLRCKELNFLLDKLQKSLLEKMKNENSLSTPDKLRLADQKSREDKRWFLNMLAEKNLIRLKDGRIIKREEKG